MDHDEHKGRRGPQCSQTVGPSGSCVGEDEQRDENPGSSARSQRRRSQPPRGGKVSPSLTLRGPAGLVGPGGRLQVGIGGRITPESPDEFIGIRTATAYTSAHGSDPSCGHAPRAARARCPCGPLWLDVVYLAVSSAFGFAAFLAAWPQFGAWIAWAEHAASPRLVHLPTPLSTWRSALLGSAEATGGIAALAAAADVAARITALTRYRQTGVALASPEDSPEDTATKSLRTP
jgi:hypothetical protein